jgi:microcystin-dependent protein
MIHLTQNAVNIVYLSLKERHKDFGIPSGYVLRFENLQDSEVITFTATVVAENDRVTVVSINTTTTPFNSAQYRYLAYGIVNDQSVLFEEGVCVVAGNTYQSENIITPIITVNYESPE